MLDGYHILTLTHRHAPLDEIGNVLVPGADEQAVAEKLRHLQTVLGWQEVLYLATCNRVLYFFYTPQPLEKDYRPLFLETLRPDLSPQKIAVLASRTVLLNGADALRHLFEVAASMDSLVVGEREILRQLREAYEHCQAEGLTGDHIRLAMRQAIEAAKEVYTQTDIGEKSVSIVSLAFSEMLKAPLSPDARVLLVGAGQTNTLFAKFLAKKGFWRVTVFNRTLEKAQVLAQDLGGNALSLSDLENFREGFDVLVICTASQTPIVTPVLFQKLLAGETGKKVVVDLSVPHNVARTVVLENPSLHYIEIESLRDTARAHLGCREKERPKADALLTARVIGFREIWHERQVERALAHIPEAVRAVRERAVEQVFHKEFQLLDAAAQETVLKMLAYMEKKCVAIPMKAAKAIALGHSRRNVII